MEGRASWEAMSVSLLSQGAAPLPGGHLPHTRWCPVLTSCHGSVLQIVHDAVRYHHPHNNEIVAKLVNYDFSKCPCRDNDGDRVRPRHDPCTYVSAHAANLPVLQRHGS